MTPSRVSLALLAALIPLNAAAQLSTSLTTPASNIPTGGTIAFAAAVRNTHSAPLTFGYTFSVDEGRILSFDAPDCTYIVHYLVQCTAQNVPAGASIPFRFTAQATNDEGTIGQVLSASVTASTVIPDDQPVFSSTHVDMPVTRSPVEADLAVTLDAGPSNGQPQPLDAVERAVTVTNLGPSVAGPVAIAFDAQGAALRLVSASAPWTCTPDPGPSAHFACTIPRLGIGESPTLRLRLATTVARSYGVEVSAWAADATDPDIANSFASGSIVAGTATDLARILVPVLARETPGSRATWTTHLSAMSPGQDATLFFCAAQCRMDGVQLRAGWTTSIWPGTTLPGAAPQGAMMYLERGAEPRTTFTARLSSSRASEARGVELPIVRESDFRTDRLVIPAIRLDAEHRFLLRVYDPDALPGSAVTVRLFELFLSRVLAEETLVLATQPQTLFGSLPAFPGYGQSSAIFDAALPAAGSREVGLEIVGLRPGQKIWAFVSATENAGEHVTLITPQ